MAGINSAIEAADDWKAITPSDTADVPVVNSKTPKSLYVGGAGDVRVESRNGSDEVFTVPAGVTLPVKNVKRVWSTDTTATNIVGLY